MSGVVAEASRCLVRGTALGVGVGRLEVSDIDLEVGSGEVVAVRGQAGPALLYALAGLLPLTAGELKIGRHQEDESRVGRRERPYRRSGGVVLLDGSHDVARQMARARLAGLGIERSAASRRRLSYPDEAEVLLVDGEGIAPDMEVVALLERARHEGAATVVAGRSLALASHCDWVLLLPRLGPRAPRPPPCVRWSTCEARQR